MYAENLVRNAVHGADSDENARREAHFHFAGTEIFDRHGILMDIDL